MKSMHQTTDGLASVIADKRRPNAALHATYTPQNWSVEVLHPGEDWQSCRTGSRVMATGTYHEVIEEMRRPIIGVRLVGPKGEVHGEQLTTAAPLREPEPKKPKPRPMRRQRGR